MPASTIRELLSDPEALAELLSKALPDTRVDVEDVRKRLQMFLELDDERLDLDRFRQGPRGELSEEQQRLARLQDVQKGAHTIYSIAARHHRIEPYETDWTGKDCQSVRVTLPQAYDPNAHIWTYLGVVKASDHKLFSIDQVVADYEAKYGTKPTVGRVDLITGARHLDLDRFSPISILLAYEKADDETPSFYFLESGSAQGSPEALYYAPDMVSDIHTQADFQFTPMACAANWYSGGLKMDTAGVEPTQVFNTVAQNKDGTRSYLELTANYTVVDPGAVKWPVSAQAEATMRVFALAQGMGVSLVPEALQGVLAQCALAIYDWDQKPPLSGDANGYFGCPKP